MRKRVEVEKDKSRGEKEDVREYEEKGKGGIDKSRGEKEDMKEYEEKGKGGIDKSRGEKEDMKEYEEKGEKKKQMRAKGGSGE